VGALVALALDVGLLATAGLLLLESVSEATGLVLCAAIGVIVAPIIGAWYGPTAIVEPAARWRPDAIRTLLRIGVTLVVAWVVWGALVGPAEGGLIGILALAAYRVLYGMLAVLVAIYGVAIPLGVAWLWLLRRWAHRRSSTAP
jgi:hypothetical protein